MTMVNVQRLFRKEVEVKRLRNGRHLNRLTEGEDIVYTAWKHAAACHDAGGI